MVRNHDDQNTIRQYLLRELDDDQQQRIEQRLLVDDELFEELEIAEDELIDDYLAEALSPSESNRFEQSFLATPDRKQKLSFARALRKHVSSVSPPNVIKTGKFSRPRSVLPIKGRQPFFASPLALAAVVLIVAGLGFAIWRGFVYESEVDRGLLALNAAYSQQRPLESRITKFDYAPYVTTRGAGPTNVNEAELTRAELTLLDALKDKPTPTVHHALGKVYLTKRDFDRAIELLNSALKGDPNNAQIYADLGAAWLERGKPKLEKTSRSPESGKGMEDLGRSLENLHKALELDNTLLEALFNKALAEQYILMHDQAEQDWREYLKRDSASPWADEARRNLKLLEERKATSASNKEQLIGDFHKAYEARNDDAAWAALSLSRSRTGNSIVENLLDDFLALANSGRADDANAKLRAIQYAGTLEETKVHDKFTSDLAAGYAIATPAQRGTRAQARGLMKSAIGLYNKAEWQQAIDLFSKSRESFAKADDEIEILFAEVFIGYSFLRVPDPENALLIFQRLSKLFQIKGYRSFYAQSLLALADALGSQNEFSKVMEYAGKSLGVSEQIHDYANVIRCLQAQTVAQNIVGNYQEALATTFRALSVAERIPPDAKVTWPSHHEASIAFYFLGMPSVALQFENEALRLALEAKLSYQASRSYDRLALIHERLNNFDEALKNSEKARAEGIEMKDGRAKTNVLAHSALNFGRLYRETGNPQRALESYDQAIDLYQKLNLNIYQYQSRKGRLLALIELGNDTAAEAELDTVVQWFEQNREKIAEESYRNKFFDTDQNAYDVAVDFQYTRKKDEARAFGYAEAYRARSLLDMKSTGAQIIGGTENPELKLLSSASPLRLTEIQQKLPQQTQLIQYSVLDDKVLAWVVTKEKLKSGYTNISRSELDEKIRHYSRMLSRPASNQEVELNSLAKELYTILIKPVVGYLDSSRQICIVPDDNLSFVPFAALLSPISGKYLVEDYAIETAPSATIFIDSSAKAVKREKIESERLVIVGNPTFDREQFPGMPYLPGAEREAKEIARLYGATPLVGNAAVARRVKQLLGEADVAHLATHAIPDERSPLLSKLLLSADESKDQVAHHVAPGVLQASEIYGMKFPRTRLVVLSACQTGIERAYRGEGAIGLARPFIAAGVPLVIASLWPVESESTADLMISFHKYRKQNISTVEALRRAQLEILHKQQAGSPKNYGWAAFVVIGGHATF
jgi:CHAT domain-containing protein/lipoprotein NlpI